MPVSKQKLPPLPQFTLQTIFILVSIFAVAFGIWRNFHAVWGLLFLNYVAVGLAFYVKAIRRRCMFALIFLSLHTLLITVAAVLVSFSIPPTDMRLIAVAMLIYGTDMPINWLMIRIDLIPHELELWYLACLVPLGGGMWFSFGLLSNFFTLLDRQKRS